MILSLVIQKGGVGKTTGAVFLSQFLSYIKHYKVLLIDLDPQANATSALIDYEDTPTLFEVIYRKSSLSDAIIQTKIKGLSILPSNESSLYALESALRDADDGPHILKDFARDYFLDENVDFVIFDCPPNLGRLTVAALAASRFAVVPLESKIYAKDALVSLDGTFDRIRERFNPQLEPLGYFINRFDERTKLSRAINTAYQEVLGDMLMKTHVRNNISIDEAVAEKENLFVYDGKSKGAQDIIALGEELLNRLIVKGYLLKEEVAL